MSTIKPSAEIRISTDRVDYATTVDRDRGIEVSPTKTVTVHTVDGEVIELNRAFIELLAEDVPLQTL